MWKRSGRRDLHVASRPERPYCVKKCAPKVQAEIAKLCAAGEKASAIKIAARMRKGTLHQYILRDIPPDTWEQVQAEAARRGISAKEFIFGAIKDALKHP